VIVRRGATAIWFAGILFFAVVAWQVAGQESPSPEWAELKVVVDKLAAENAKLRESVVEQEKTIRSLTEAVALARSESELFQKRWAEARLRAQTLGVDFGDADAARTERQLIEGIRALYLSETSRRQLEKQLQRLVEALNGHGDVLTEATRAKELLADLQPANEAGKVVETGAMDAIRVVDVNVHLRLVVLNVGLMQGARVGMPLALMRGDRVVGELKIVEVRKSVSGALIERLDKNVTVTAGDVVRVTKS
jgi:hypothetical protein